MENDHPLLKKIQDKLCQFLNTSEVLKLMDHLAHQGIWLDITLEPKGPGIFNAPDGSTLFSPFKEKVLSRFEDWAKDYDDHFLKINRIKL